MWLRRLVGIFMIITCLGMSVMTVLGLLMPNKLSQQAAVLQDTTSGTKQTANPLLPIVTLTAQPAAIGAGTNSSLTWSTTGSPTVCTASGDWKGQKTAFGSESTGRIINSGNYTYTLSCTNDAGKAEASTVVTVGDAAPPPQSRPSAASPTPSPSAAVAYCGGRLPCHGPRDVAAHGYPGNCWGWNGERVINVSGFNASYHIAQSGISTIETGQVCGKDLGPSLRGEVSVAGQSRNHNPATKSNADAYMIPYFVGYFDANKP